MSERKKNNIFAKAHTSDLEEDQSKSHRANAMCRRKRLRNRKWIEKGSSKSHKLEG